MAATIDVVILGAGAAGLFCGAEAARRGRNVLVLDHAAKPAEKVRISGGGRCNFTNLHTAPENFISANPHFCKSALARYTQWDFLDLISRHDIAWHEKTLGQLFCDGRSAAIIEMLLTELSQAGGALRLETEIRSVSKPDNRFRVETANCDVLAESLVVATGGLSIPKMGATGFAYDLARRFGHGVIEPRPALVPLTFSGQSKDDFAGLSGVAANVVARAGGAAFQEAMLFTHRGLSGPAVLQASSYWRPGDSIEIDLLAGTDGFNALKRAKADQPRRTLAAALSDSMPKRLIGLLTERDALPGAMKLADLSHDALRAAAKQLSAWTLKPSGTEGWRTAEVTAGGVDTDGLSSRTMESRHVEGLYFIGECVDVTGWLGGYNFQWAWSSGWAAGQAV